MFVIFCQACLPNLSVFCSFFCCQKKSKKNSRLQPFFATISPASLAPLNPSQESPEAQKVFLASASFGCPPAATNTSVRAARRGSRVEPSRRTFTVRGQRKRLRSEPKVRCGTPKLTGWRANQKNLLQELIVVLKKRLVKGSLKICNVFLAKNRYSFWINSSKYYHIRCYSMTSLPFGGEVNDCSRWPFSCRLHSRFIIQMDVEGIFFGNKRRTSPWPTEIQTTWRKNNVCIMDIYVYSNIQYTYIDIVFISIQAA